MGSSRHSGANDAGSQCSSRPSTTPSQQELMIGAMFGGTGDAMYMSGFLDVAEPIKLSKREMSRRGAGGELIRTEEEIMEYQATQLEEWIKQFVKSDPSLEEAYYSVPDESFVVQQLKEDMSLGELRATEMSRRLTATKQEQQHAAVDANRLFRPVQRAAAALGEFSGKSSSGRDKLLREVELQCDHLGKAFTSQLAIDYKAAYAEGRRDLHVEEIKQIQHTLATEYRDYADFGATRSCVEAKISHEVQPIPVQYVPSADDVPNDLSPTSLSRSLSPQNAPNSEPSAGR